MLPKAWLARAMCYPFTCTPSPPYLNCQFPVPVPIPCSPHFGLPTMGLGMAMLPMPPNHYMEVPGYVLQSPQLPLADFRQVVDPSLLMNLYPQRFRPPNPGSMQVVSSGVQTEPPAAVEHVTKSDMRSESGRGTCCAASGSPLTSPGSTPQTSVYLQPDNQAGLGHEDYVTQEDIRRACGEVLPKGVCLHMPLVELSALKGSAGSHSAQGDCRPADGAVFAYRPPLHSSSHCTDVDGGKRRVPDLLAREASQSYSLEGHERGGASAPDLSPVHVKSSVWDKEEEEEQASDAEDEMFKIVRLPFDGQFAAAWREVAEQSVWSVGSLPSLVPSPQWLARHGLAPGESGSAEACVARSKPGDDVSLVVAVTEERQRYSTSSDSLPPYVPAASWLSEFRHVHCCGWAFPGARECCAASRGPRGRQVRSHAEQQRPQLRLGEGGSGSG
ncbi:uncharacterized protein LOC125740190 [Brienomyrus brachyistius]|uniref:uncharacterized protein LOC125740190 n=1 Tax=Brienomyrus brachyistius TaxID=42636 RepID=UPI0020B20AF8|nr:uncharacterized protein LOC125740190 [Brienomyrus brachyistius]